MGDEQELGTRWSAIFGPLVGLAILGLAVYGLLALSGETTKKKEPAPLPRIEVEGYGAGKIKVSQLALETEYTGHAVFTANVSITEELPGALKAECFEGAVKVSTAVDMPGVRVGEVGRAKIYCDSQRPTRIVVRVE